MRIARDPSPVRFCDSEFVDLVDLENQPGEGVVVACGDRGAIGPFAVDDVTAARLWNGRASVKARS